MAPVKGVCIIDLEAGEGRIKHSPAWHDDHVQARHDLMTPENLSREAFGAIPLNRGAEFPAGRYAEPRDCPAVGDDEQGHEAGRYANA